MKKFKKALLSILSLALVAVLSIGGTLAYLTSEDSDVNVMTMGNVKIAQHEYERATNADGTYKTANIDTQTSYVLKKFTQDKPLYPAIIPNGGTVGGVKWDYDQTTVRMSQVNSYGGAQVFNTPNAQDKFVTVENTGKSDAYVRTLIAFEVGTATLEDDAYKYQPLISSEIRAEVAEKNKNGTQPWTYGYMDYVTINGNKYLVYELVYTGAKLSNGNWRHKNGVLPAGDTTYPNLAQVYMASRATNEDVEALDGNNNGKYDILVLSQAVQTKGFDNAKAALDTAFGTVEDNAAEWFKKYNVVVAQPASGAVRPAGYNPVTEQTNVVDGITVIDNSDENTNLRALYTGDGNKVSGDLTVTNSYLDGTYAMNVIGNDTGVLTVSNTDLRGWVSYDGFKSATFSNTTFGKNSNAEIYNTIRPYSSVTFTNCDFDGTEFWLDKLAADEKVTFVNCTMNGEVIDSTDDIKIARGSAASVVIK